MTDVRRSPRSPSFDNGLGRYVAGKPLITGIGESNTFRGCTTRLSRSTACQTVMEFSKQLTGVEWTADRGVRVHADRQGRRSDAGWREGWRVDEDFVGKPDSGDTQTFDFGNIKYESAGKYEYEVKETKGDLPPESPTTSTQRR